LHYDSTRGIPHVHRDVRSPRSRQRAPSTTFRGCFARICAPFRYAHGVSAALRLRSDFASAPLLTAGQVIPHVHRDDVLREDVALHREDVFDGAGRLALHPEGQVVLPSPHLGRGLR
jgi:hypothetical protein